MTTLVFLPAGDAGLRWLRLADDGVVGEGDGAPATEEPVVAVPPADAVALHWAALPARSLAQATAAARILAADASAGPVTGLHVAVGSDEDGDERPIAIVDAADMQGWLAVLARAGVDPVAMVPAPLLLPRPEQGYVRGEVAGQGVVRGAASGFADEARLTELVTGGEAPETLARGALATAMARAAARPALDLRQGAFARRRQFAIDWPLVRRLGWMLAAVLALGVAISVVRIIKYDAAATAAEAEAERLARQGLPRGETINNADRQLDARLAGLRGPGLGFTRTAAAVFAAVRAVEGSEVTAMAFTSDGALRATVATAGEGQANELRQRIEAAGFSAAAGTFQAAGGRVTGELTVRPR